MGYLKNRAHILHEMQRLPRSVVASNLEVLDFIGRNALFGRGIGYVDAHLLVSTILTSGATLWARDKRLFAAAQEFKVGAVI